MSGDYTRSTFRPERRYSSVRLQQGRIQLDADWNEAADIALATGRAGLADVVGATGVPDGAAGFALVPADPDGAGTATDLLIGRGRAYVDGLLVDNGPPEPTALAPVAGAPDTFVVVSGPRPREGQWLVGPPGSGLAPSRVVSFSAPEPADRGLIRVALSPPPPGTAPRMLVADSLRVQPDLAGGAVPDQEGTFLAYLEVVEREVTALDDPLLRETALGGPDTALRTQVVWRVRVMPATGNPPSCKDYPPGWRPDPRPKARLTARGVPAEAADDPCLTPDPGGYRGIDNRLYRVEVLRGGEVGGRGVRIAWSRDNAIHRTRFTLSANRLRVESLGRDAATALDQGQWVEVQSPEQWASGVPGLMVRLGEVNGQEIAIAEIRSIASEAVLTGPGGAPLVSALPPEGLLRRWEGGPPVAVMAGAPIALEAGIEVTIGEGALEAGDAWLIPARALSASVEWPADPASGEPAALPPLVIARRFMPLGLIGRLANGRLLVRSDCRRVFSPLADLVQVVMLGGDGQEAMPAFAPPGATVPLAHPFRVGVSRGASPLAGRAVRFRTLDPSEPGRLLVPPGMPSSRVLRHTASELVVLTDQAGVAEAGFAVHARRTAYAVEAVLLDARELDRADPVALPIRFFAAAEVADEVAYRPTACGFLQRTPGEQEPATTVQQAIDRLCPPLRLVALGGDGQIASPGEMLPLPLRVGLIWGGRPLAGVSVAVSVQRGDATAPSAVTTGADGTASVVVAAGRDATRDGGVILVRMAPSGLPVPCWPADLVFSARFAPRAAAEPPRLRPTDILWVGPGGRLQQMRGGQPIPLAEFANQGFLVVMDGPLSPQLREAPPLGEVWLDLPFNPQAPTAPGAAGTIAYRPVGRWQLADEKSLRWSFDPPAQGWIRDVLRGLMQSGQLRSLTGGFAIHGGRVRGREDDTPRWLDGALLFDGGGLRAPKLPGGIGLPGTTMTMPFAIVS